MPEVCKGQGSVHILNLFQNVEVHWALAHGAIETCPGTDLILRQLSIQEAALPKGPPQKEPTSKWPGSLL